jgi:hypothetical protein
MPLVSGASREGGGAQFKQLNPQRASTKIGRVAIWMHKYLPFVSNTKTDKTVVNIHVRQKNTPHQTTKSKSNPSMFTLSNPGIKIIGDKISEN